MENTTMTNGPVAMTGTATRIRSAYPQPAITRLLADTLGGHQGSTVPTSVRIVQTKSEILASVATSTPTNYPFMDAAQFRSGGPPV